MMPPRVIASTSSARSSSASVISFRFAHDLADRLAGARRLLHDLGRRLVADVRVERGADRRRRLRVRLAAGRRWLRCRRCTCSANTVHTLREQRDRLEEVAGDHRHEHVQLEVALRAGERRSSASLPITCAPTCVTTSGITGFTLPGMIDEPGCRSGSADLGRGRCAVRSPIQRRSLAILTSATASTRQLPARLDERVARALRGEVVLRLGERQPGALREPRDHLAGEALRRVDARCRPRCRRAAARRAAAACRRAARSPSSTCAA